MTIPSVDLECGMLLILLAASKLEDDAPAIPDGRNVTAAAVATSGTLIWMKVLRSMIIELLPRTFGLQR